MQYFVLCTAISSLILVTNGTMVSLFPIFLMLHIATVFSVLFSRTVYRRSRCGKFVDLTLIYLVFLRFVKICQREPPSCVKRVKRRAERVKR